MSWLSEHYSYACDVQRTVLYRAAVEKTVRSADHVLDLGCGVGILGALCLEAGAARITGIDETPACDVAPGVYRRASDAAPITMLRESSFDVELKDRVDLIICDHVGYFGLDYGILSLLQDARGRFLATGGTLMPSGLTLKMAPVGSDDCRQLAYGWSASGVPEPLHALREKSVNAKHAVTLRPQDVLGHPVELGHIDFRTETNSFFSFRSTTEITQAGEMNGIAGWFDCMLCEGVSMTNDPMVPQKIDRSQAFFPIETPIDVAPGDTVSFSIAMRPDDGMFAWTLDHKPSGKRFRHATLHSTVLRKQDLQSADQARVPHPSKYAEAGRIVMDFCDGKRSIAEVHDAVRREHPDLFPSRQASEDFVNEWLAQWTL